MMHGDESEPSGALTPESIAFQSVARRAIFRPEGAARSAATGTPNIRLALKGRRDSRQTLEKSIAISISLGQCSSSIPRLMRWFDAESTLCWGSCRPSGARRIFRGSKTGGGASRRTPATFMPPLRGDIMNGRDTWRKHLQSQTRAASPATDGREARPPHVRLYIVRRSPSTARRPGEGYPRTSSYFSSVMFSSLM